MNPTSPETFGKYRILERIASGGFTEIYKARLDGAGGFHRTFAIKRVLPHLSANQEFVDLLVDEAKVAGLLSHANIVQILDLGRIDAQVYIAMEYVAGRDLGRILARCRQKGITLPVPHAVFVAIEALKGLEYAHNRQVLRDGRPVPLHVVHGDISPSNVLVSSQGEVKLTDFGMARATARVAGLVTGRFDYVSPERASGSDVGQQGDLFSMGVVLYELLTGEHPFRKDSDRATLEAIRQARVTPPSHVNMDVPAHLDDVVARALAAEPAERLPTATGFKEELDRFFQESQFIFTQSTLAAFLKGLFPEQRTAPPTLPAAPPAPDAPLDQGGAPTSVPGAGLRRPRTFPTDPPPRPRPPGESIREAASLLRRLPDPGAPPDYAQPGLSDAATLIRRGPPSDVVLGDLETQIRRNPSLGGPPVAPDPDRPVVRLQDQPTLPLGGSPAARAAPVPVLATPTFTFPQPARPAPAGLLVLSVITLVLGLTAGYIAGTRSGGASGEAVLEIRAPTGTEAVLDGRRLEGVAPWRLSVSPGVSHAVRVTQDGRTPLFVPVVVLPGQTRVLDVEVHDLELARP